MSDKASTSGDLPLSYECKLALAYGAEEAERLSHKHISTEHLLLGLLREEKCFAAEMLRERGLRLSGVREQVAETVSLPGPARSSLMSRFGRDLTQSAMDGHLNPAFAREKELERVIETLCRYANNNPLLIGEPAVARSITEALAQQIVDGRAPIALGDKKIFAFDLSLLEAESSDPARCKEIFRSSLKELAESPTFVLLIENMGELFTSLSADGWLDGAALMEFHMSASKGRCIAATSSREYRNTIQKHQGLAKCFVEIRLAPLNEVECRTALVGLKQSLEKFHGVLFDDSAMAAGLVYAKHVASEDSLLTRAIDVLDEAGAQRQLRKGELPEDMWKVQKRIRFIVNRMESALANHDFVEASAHSDEERKEREVLRQLREKYHMDETASDVPITQADIEAVVRLWAGSAAG